eukprot:92368-Rhodomonas_salina.1
MSTSAISIYWKEHLTRFGPSGAEAAKQEQHAANLTWALRELDLEHLEAPSASQPNPVAVAQAKVAVAQAKQEAAEAGAQAKVA